MKLLFALTATLLLASAPGLASAAEVHVDTHPNVVVYNGAAVTVVRRPHARVVVVRDADADCAVRTVRTWIDGRYVKRRVTYCGS